MISQSSENVPIGLVHDTRTSVLGIGRNEKEIKFLRMVSITGISLRKDVPQRLPFIHLIRESPRNFNGDRHEGILHFLKKNEERFKFSSEVYFV